MAPPGSDPELPSRSVIPRMVTSRPELMLKMRVVLSPLMMTSSELVPERVKLLSMTISFAKVMVVLLPSGTMQIVWPGVALPIRVTSPEPLSPDVMVCVALHVPCAWARSGIPISRADSIRAARSIASAIRRNGAVVCLRTVLYTKQFDCW